MSTTADLTSVIRHLRPPTANVGDPELLERYARGNDQAAFAEAVRLDPKQFGPQFRERFPPPVAPPPREVKRQ